MDPRLVESDGSSSLIDALASPHSYPQHGPYELRSDETRGHSPIIVNSYLYSSSSSDDDKDDGTNAPPAVNSIISTNRRLDYMLQFLDRKLSFDHDNQHSGQGNNSRPRLPEFVAKGGGSGIFKVPIRAAVHPLRPPSLDLRPHPLRETQIGRFLRVIASTESQLWAASECGVRFWNFRDIYAAWSGVEETVRRGDEDTAPFSESVWTSPALCMVTDEGNRLVWSGHKDGKIRCWLMDQSLDENWRSPFNESLSWQAHRGPVLSLTKTSYGELLLPCLHFFHDFILTFFL